MTDPRLLVSREFREGFIQRLVEENRGITEPASASRTIKDPTLYFTSKNRFSGGRNKGRNTSKPGGAVRLMDVLHRIKQL
jgi:hypothetical protein